jgi:glycine hydroxymethyltransferase
MRTPEKTALLAVERLLGEVLSYELETAQYIRLIPTEGLMSPLQKHMYLSRQHERYLHAPPENSEKAIRYPDIVRLQAVYELARHAICQTFACEFAIPDMLSGLQAITIAVLAYSSVGDTILSVNPAHGGHPMTTEIATSLGRHCSYLPFSVAEHNIYVTRSLDLKMNAPALIFLDQSNVLYAADIAGLRKMFPRAALVIDVSQTAALVAGHCFPNPLLQGATAIVASAHKSLCGPQKAFLATDEPQAYSAALAVTQTFISNNHPASVAALAVCLLEARQFGDQFAVSLIETARTLARDLSLQGVPVVAATEREHLTDTHQVWLDCELIGWKAEEAAAALKSAGIIVNTLFISSGSSGGRKGLRLGTTEVARLGMGNKEMRIIASSIARVLVQRTSPPGERSAITELRERFRKTHFCFDLQDLDARTQSGLEALRRDL